MKVPTTILAISALALLGANAAAQRTNSVDPHANETKAERDARMKWWREARFGMFIHWGVYSVPAGTYDGNKIGGIGEWIMHSAHIPVARYALYADQFDPEKFNASEWVSYAKAAGMKYIVMTAKHHDGFCMFPTLVDDWNINARTKFKRDPVGEMSAACKKAGIRFGVYYSQNLDWHHEGGGTAGPAWDKAQKGDFHAYVKNVSAPQVKELLSKYHPAVLWWDINGPFSPEEVKALTAGFADNPGLIANNRLGGGVPGDTETPEQFIPATGFKGRDWETCMTMNDTWGYKSYDTNFKSTSTLVRNLIDIASKGGNYLLNVGPTSEGIIPGPEVDRLKEVGQWMKVNGDSIYATSASPYKKLPFEGRATVKSNTLFLNVFTWPSTGLVLPGLQTHVKGAKVVSTGEKLKVTKNVNGTLSISAPSQTNVISTAIALSLDSAPVVVEPEVQLLPVASGSYVLGANDATLDGSEIKVQDSGENANVGFWTNPSDSIIWKITTPVKNSGKFELSLDYSCPPDVAGSTFSIVVDGVVTGVNGTVGKTDGWNSFRTVKLEGMIALNPGKHSIQIKVTNMPHFAVMNVRKLTLDPLS